MNNAAFIEWIERIGQKKLAETIGVSKQAVWNWRHGINKPTPYRAKRLVEVSNGSLTLEDIYGK